VQILKPKPEPDRSKFHQGISVRQRHLVNVMLKQRRGRNAVEKQNQVVIVGSMVARLVTF